MSTLISPATAFAAGAAFALLPALLIARRRALLPAPLRPEILLFGDSITQQSFAPGGWGAAVADAYQRTADVRLRGYSGYNTRWAIEALPKIFPGKRAAAAPALVTVLLGANDANRPAPLKGLAASASRQYVPLDEYVENLRSIMAAATAAGAPRLLLITPPPLDEAGWHACCVRDYGVPKDADPNRSYENTKKYAEAVMRLGKETNTPTLDLHAAFEERADWKACLRDGLHPNAAGGRLIGEAVLEAIAEYYPELRPSAYGDADAANKLPMDFPDHKAVDAEGDYKASFREYLK